MIDEEAYKKAKNYAWQRLARKSQPSAELKAKLKERACSDEIIDRIIRECSQAGYLDDIAWVNAYVKREINRSQSPRSIAYKLQIKGVSKDLIQEAIENNCGFEERAQGIRALIAKKSRNLDLKDRAQRDKLIAGILRKGFNLSEVLKIINEN